ncbi:transferase [Bacillus sp. AFS015802]|uniref:acetyltransferase n=1 Tax=Bacillus sp. AFS015802 TaxID=2033486 RepID=UPI000BF362A2|nr:acetyltransferase [Bacillus sp. AFS015802]PFA67797.1 transferase [Bacillus sp. AFS015802]
MNKIVIIGAGGLGREVSDVIKDINRNKATWEVIGFLDDSIEKKEQVVNGHSVLGTTSAIKHLGNIDVVCAIGNPSIKQKVVNQIKSINPSVIFKTLIHPSAKIGSFSNIGEGSIVCAGAIITSNITIGDHVLINIATTIGHDVVIGSFSTIYPGSNISGYVQLGENVEIGAGSVVIPHVKIGKSSILGAGGVAIRDLPDHCTAVGVPAKPIKSLKE